MTTDFIDRYQMIPEGARVLCAVSGGADSIYLLHNLKLLQNGRDFTLLAAHFEHGLRGDESLRDMMFTEAQCKALGIPCTVGHGDAAAFASKHRMGLEEAARVLRYRFLEDTADSLSCSRIATAHTLNDNAETVLMNLCRGSGTRGLGGIPPTRGRLVRPLLQTGREEIEAFLRLNGIPWIEDSTNAEDACRRNRFRHRILPLMLEENPEVLYAVGRTAELTREDDACLCRLAQAFLDENLKTFPPSVPATGQAELSVSAKKLLELEPAVSTRVLRMLCGNGLSRERTEALLRFAGGTEPGVLELPGGRKVRRRGGKLFFNSRN